MIQTGIKISATQTLKDMLSKGWEIISSKKENQNTFLVTLKKVYQNGKNIFEEVKTIFVGYWALPKKIKVKGSEKYRKMRGGTPKPARMCYV